jgi:signal peptidase I
MNQEKEKMNTGNSQFPEDDNKNQIPSGENNDIDLFTKKEIFTTTEEKLQEIPQEQKKRKKETVHSKKWKLLRDLLLNVVVLVFVLIVIRGFIALPFEVSGSSMESTLHDKELIYVDLFTPYIRGIKRGDVVVFHPPTGQTTNTKGPTCFINKLIAKVKGNSSDSACIVPISYVKRIIGVPGDTIEIKGGNVYLTDKTGKKQEISEPYLNSENKGKTCITGSCRNEEDINGKVYVVPEGQYFLMGDNRLHSSDSRAWNFVKRESITGVVRAVFFYHGSDSFTRTFSESLERIRIIHSIDPLPQE